MHRKPNPRFDYEYLNGLVDSSAPIEVFVLHEPAQQILSQLAEIVLWTRTRWYNGTEAEIETLAHQVYEELKVPYHFDDLIPLLDDVETLLRELKALGNCCPENVTYFPDAGVPNPGYSYDGPTFPDPWGPDETVADLTDYQQLICGAAHAYVDYLAGIGATLDSLVTTGAVVVGAIAAILGILSGAGILLVIEYTTVAAVVSAIVSGATASLFTSASDAIESARADLVCAMLTFDGDILKDAIETAIPALAFDLFFQWIDYQSALNVMQTGEYNGDTLPVSRRTDCDCVDYSNPASGFYYAVRIDDGDINLVPKEVFGSTCDITPVYDASIGLKSLELDGMGTQQGTSTFGLLQLGPIGPPCSDIKGLAFTVDNWYVDSTHDPNLWANINHWFDSGSGRPLEVGQRVAMGNFQYGTQACKDWLDANFDVWVNLTNGLGEYFGISHATDGAPYQKACNIQLHNVYWLALTSSSNCPERYS